jgi:hypothetical protein
MRTTIETRVRELFPTQRWTSAFCYTFYEGSDGNKEDIEKFCESLIDFFTLHASEDYVSNHCSLSARFRAIRERARILDSEKTYSYSIVNCSDLSATFGGFYEAYNLAEHNTTSMSYDYLFHCLGRNSERALRASKASANSFRTLGSVSPVGMCVLFACS